MPKFWMPFYGQSLLLSTTILNGKKLKISIQQNEDTANEFYYI